MVIAKNSGKPAVMDVENQNIKNFIKGIIFPENGIDFKKRWNYMKMQWNSKVQKSILLSNYPISITLGTGPICNLRCKLCPVGQKRSGRKIGFLTKEVVERVIEELGPYLFGLELYNWGEPLLNKNIFEYIRLLREADIQVSVSTNLSIKDINDNICREMINSGLDSLIVSLDGNSQESVEQYQIGSNYERVISNLKKIADYRNLIGSNHPMLRWRFVVTRFNENEIKNALKICKEVGFDYFELVKIKPDMGNELLWDTKTRLLNIEPYLPKDERLSIYNYTTREIETFKHNFCSYLWSSTTINWNGSVSPCPTVWEEHFDFGNILETPFKEIWNGKKYQLARKIIRSNKPIEVPDLICSICKKNNAIFFNPLISLYRI
ncbi:MAG: radical SAM/SPASM domain-containing protein [Promethearchaeota archaeon]